MAHLAGGEEDDGDDGSALDAPVEVVWPRHQECDERARRDLERKMATSSTTRGPWSERNALAEARYSGELRSIPPRRAAVKTKQGRD